MTRLSCGIVITSYDRRDDLRRTCIQLRKLDPRPEEIIICLDGCTDGSREMLEAEFPECRLIENATPQGSIPSRDRAFRLVTSDLIITLDDDSYPVDPAFLEKVSQLVLAHPEAAAFTFPEIRDDGGPASPNMAVTSPGHYARDFPNCAGVIVRSLYGSSAEYRPFFSHAYAEPDYCLQLYAAGYTVWFEPSLHIRHHFTPHQRNMLNRHLLNARNELWSVLMRCPAPQIIVIAPLRILRQLIFAVSQGWSWLRREPTWWWDAFVGLRECLSYRAPIRWREYWAWVRLARRPAFTIKELETRFGKRFPRPTARPLNDKSPISVMITTRNRSGDLKHTLKSLIEMECGPDEILVTPDGCTDDTVEMLNRDFPQCRVFANDVPSGSVASRDRMIRQAAGDIIVSLDDDSYPADSAFFKRLSELFSQHPNAAVITFSELRDGGMYSTGLRTPGSRGHYVSAYPNCAAAMKRVVYLQQPGFPKFFEHMYEETDYALQCYADGYSVWFEPSLTIRHHLSPKNRGWMRRHHLNARNELWSVWMRCPWPWLPIVSLFRIVRQFQYACTEGALWVVNEPRWWFSAVKGIPKCIKCRCTVPWSVYYKWMRLARHPRFAPTAFHPREELRLENEIRLPASGPR
jgi:GT2 family glycosyltransferase